MICLKTLRRTGLAALIGSISIAWADHPEGDVVTMRNGDIHIGNIEPIEFTIDSELGELKIPLASMRRLSIVGSGLDILVETDAGESVKGVLEPGDLRVSRLQDPTLPIALADILRIDFGHQQADATGNYFPSRLETNDGEQLNVKVLSKKLSLSDENEFSQYDVSHLRFIDISLHTFEDQLLTQLSLSNGSRHQGQLKSPSIAVTSPYRAAMEIPADRVSRLTMDRFEPDRNTDLSFSDSLRSLGSGPQMIRIRGGRYFRGDHQGDGDDDEKPLSEISLKPFAISVTEITFGDYDIYCQQSRKCREPDDQEWGRGQRPVINVSWEEASAYARWLADKTGKAYRLPSDAEWEYAHRAGNTARYAWGNEVESARANCEGCGSIWDGDQTAPVGRFQPNAFGLYDTAGNVFEWVADCYHDTFSEAPHDGSPFEKKGCGKRVIRGGAWSFPPHEVRSANRWRDFPSRRSDDTGFRVAMDLE